MRHAMTRVSQMLHKQVKKTRTECEKKTSHYVIGEIFDAHGREPREDLSRGGPTD